MKTTTLFYRAGVLTGLLMMAGVAQCAVRASVDSNSIAANGTVELTLERDGQSSAEPDLSPLKTDFDVLSSSRSSKVQIINGAMTASARIALSLSPKHGGALRIPALTWGNEQSEPIAVDVSGSRSSSPTATAAAGSGKVFLKSSIEPAQSYVQAGIHLTVRLYSSMPLYHAVLVFPATTDVLVQPVGSDRHDTVIENGRRYQILERDYELFPQRSGSLSIAGPVLDAQIPVQDRFDGLDDSLKDLLDNLQLGDMFTSAKPIRVRGEDIALNVLPRPPAAGNEYWLPAKDVTIHGEWHTPSGKIKAGDPVTLDLHLQAQGLTAAQLPDLSAFLHLPAGLKAYPDQAKLTNDTQGGTVVGQRDQSIALIADHSGDFAIPALSVHWWDTQADKAREAILPAKTFSFAPGATVAANATDAATPALAPTMGRDIILRTPDKSGYGLAPTWFWLIVALAALWLVTLLAWALSRRRRPGLTASPPEQKSDRAEGDARRRFAEACRADDARAARAALLQWISDSSPEKRMVGLGAFARRVGRADLRQMLEELDRACYVGGVWHGAPLLAALDTLPGLPVADCAPREALEPLYK